MPEYELSANLCANLQESHFVPSVSKYSNRRVRGIVVTTDLRAVSSFADEARAAQRPQIGGKSRARAEPKDLPLNWCFREYLANS
ncbi:hypothetical protein CDAR_602521 [Caerostris darwini]|uniref:Uncharacterized protein n=1 Tax=Caerostris darwini TaxID=1538125 RepID=A0AAV4TLE1_9ARAC|nr:hypothetical protein CDAR_602521 [Caerostris darwini]